MGPALLQPKVTVAKYGLQETPKKAQSDVMVVEFGREAAGRLVGPSCSQAEPVPRGPMARPACQQNLTLPLCCQHVYFHS